MMPYNYAIVLATDSVLFWNFFAQRPLVRDAEARAFADFGTIRANNEEITVERVIARRDIGNW